MCPLAFRKRDMVFARSTVFTSARALGTLMFSFDTETAHADWCHFVVWSERFLVELRWKKLVD
jgi:hypothetical protein